MASVTKKRNYLSLKKKVEMINYSKTNPVVNIRSLADRVECGKTQVAQILKNQDTLLPMYESNASGSKIHTKTFRSSEFSDVNKARYEWYVPAFSKNIYPAGPQLEKAKQIVERLGKHNLKSSQGWLEK